MLWFTIYLFYKDWIHFNCRFLINEARIKHFNHSSEKCMQLVETLGVFYCPCSLLLWANAINIGVVKMPRVSSFLETGNGDDATLGHFE